MMITFIRTHGEAIAMAFFLAAGVFMACVLGPTLDATEVPCAPKSQKQISN